MRGNPGVSTSAGRPGTSGAGTRRIRIVGRRGLVGSAIWRRLEAEGFTGLVGKASAELDLKDRASVFAFFAQVRPRYVIVAAAKVGGILANNTYPADFISENLQI